MVSLFYTGAELKTNRLLTRAVCRVIGNVKVTVDNGLLTIRGDRKQFNEPKNRIQPRLFR